MLAVSALVGGASPAAAAARPSANRLCGAKNMVKPNALPHMVEAITLHASLPRDLDMAGAVAASSC